MADQSAGRVSLHSCFPQGLWTAYTEITGEGGTPALFCLQFGTNNMKEFSMKTTCKVLAIVVFLSGLFAGTYFAKVAHTPNYFLGCVIFAAAFGLSKILWNVK